MIEASLKVKRNNSTQKLYTERASLYEHLFVNFLGWGRELEAFFRKSDYIRPGFKILDAGCGTGIITRILYRLAHSKNHEGIQFHAFDLTQNMLDIFHQWILDTDATGIELKQADVLEIEALPSHWKEYDLIVSSTMLEYLPGDRIRDALHNLKQLLRAEGILLVFITKRNFLTEWLGKRWWKTNVFQVDEIQQIFRDVGFSAIERKRFSLLWSNSIIVIEARR